MTEFLNYDDGTDNFYEQIYKLWQLCMNKILLSGQKRWLI